MKHLCVLCMLAVLLVLSVSAVGAAEVMAPTQQPMTGPNRGPLAPQLNMARLAVGGWEHACAGAANGTLMCWGLNGYGEIGDGTTTVRPSPVYVPGLTGVTAIATGEYHTCAVINGGVKCWGHNFRGQLGINSTTDSHMPVDVQTSSSDPTPLSGVTAIAAGYMHTCAIVSGGVLCWGYNSQGQLGDGTTVDRSTPIAVSGLSGVTAITAGMSHTCALLSSGGVKCWGRGTQGQLGNNSNADSYTPVDVQASSGVSTTLSGATVVDAGDNHTCAVVNGGAKCWGVGGNGRLGNNSTTDKNAPLDVFGLTSGVSSIAAGAYHTCALTTTSRVKCWGYNLHGQLGDGTTTQRITPVDVSGLASGVSAVDTGHGDSCALMATGEIKCWGYNAHGELGIGTTDNEPHSAPLNVALPVATTAVVASSANPAVVGQTIVYTATVSTGDPGKKPTGYVAFWDGDTALGTSTLNGSAQAALSVIATGVGGHSITAVYAGVIGFDPSTSPVFSQTINKVSTLTALSAPPNAGWLGPSVVFTATVTVLAPSTGLPTGTVTFKDGTSTIAGCGTQALNNASTTSCTSSGLGAGGHAITATYNGDGRFAQSTSAALNLNVFRAYIPLAIR